MKIFCFERIENCTANYHSQGGIVIVARDKEHAKEVLLSRDHEFPQPTEEEWDMCDVYELADNYSAKLYIMPDAGCC